MVLAPCLHYRMIRILSLYLVGIELVRSKCNAPGPVALPITNLNSGTAGWMRGFPMAVGTPPQNLSFMPQAYLNDTWFYTTDNPRCQDLDVTQAACQTARGGLFNSHDSTTFKPVPSVEAAGGDPSDVQRTLGQHYWESTWAQDNLQFGNTSLPGFAIGMPQMDSGSIFDSQHNIGLGSNSTFISSLQQTGRIASRTWSWYWGLDGDAEGKQMDGSIIFGGYDKAKTTGDRFTQNLVLPEQNCQSGMRLTVTDVRLDFPNGTTTGVLGDKQILACLQPDFPVLMTMPEDPYYNNFQSLTQTQYVAKTLANGISAGPIYLPGKVYDGELTLEINNVFSVTVPNTVLVQPLVTINDDGSIFTNRSVEQVRIIAAPGDEGDTFILGRPFFSVVYLSVDYDANTFSLWQAKATADTDLQAFGGNCTSLPANTPTSHNSSSTAPSGSTDHRPMSTGAIAGIAVGCAAFAAAAGTFIVLLVFRKKKQAKRDKKSDESSTSSQTQEQTRDSYWGPRFYEAMSNGVQELGAEQHVGELNAVTAPQELTTEHASRERQRRMLQGMNSPVELG